MVNINEIKTQAFKTAFNKDAEAEKARAFFEEKLDITIKNKSDVKNAFAFKNMLDKSETVEDLKETLKYGSYFNVVNKTTTNKLNDLF